MKKNLIHSYSLIPQNFKEKDPRALMYHFPNMPKIKFVKLMTKYSYFRALEAVEECANKSGYILLPRKCMTWKRAKEYDTDRKVKVFGNSFFMMNPTELTKGEKTKLKSFIYDEVEMISA